jgi:uncharacterized membrane protein YgdD (TMEM256/DUF423 family)
MMRPHTWLVLAALLAGLAVAAGAFGAHLLAERLTARDMATFEVAARYQMYHALALGLVGLLAINHPSRLLAAAGWCFFGGSVVFSGLLYALVFTGVKLLGAFVPIGGAAMIAGWFLLAAAAWSQRGKF